MKSVKTWKKLLSVVLSSAIIVTTLAPGAVASAAENPSVQQGAEVLDFDGTSTDISSADQTENSSKNAPAEQNADDAVTPDEESNTQDTTGTAEDAGGSTPVQKQQPESAVEENKAQTKAAADTSLYQDGSICIYNEQQLRAIGNGAQVYEGDASADTFGTGAALTKEDGSALTYAADGTYTLMNDIPLTEGSAWTLPEGFAGAFNDAEVTEDAPLYDAETDTIYVYHQYQLATINDSEALKTVMSKDMIAKDFGVGQVVYEDADQAIQLEYTDEHNYVVSKEFTEEMPELTAAEVQADVSVQLGGRDYVGQVYKVIDGDPYILIGNEQQLRAIGTKTYVTPLLFKQSGNFLTGYKYEPFYPGDADINITEAGQLGTLTTDLGMVLQSTKFTKTGSLRNENDVSKANGITGIFDVDYYVVSVDDNGNKSLVLDTDADEYKDLIYTSSNNYIIFRNININGTLTDGYGAGDGDDWNPLMFNGKMEGRLNMQENDQVTLSNIEVTQNEPLNTAETIGIGFFGTISNKADDKNIGLSGGTACVKNIKLKNITVTNNTETVQETSTVVGTLVDAVSGLLKIVGGLLDAVLGPILGNLSGSTEILEGFNLEKLLTDLLDYKAEAPDTFATGAFAGRIIGDVEISGCDVEEGTVSNIGNMTGGFAGHIEGFTEYRTLEGLSKTVGLLESVLNAIPGLGLGEVVQLLLENPNLLDTTELLPSGYKQAVISDCHVSLKETKIGSQDSNFVGGFAGAVTGSKIKNSSVNNLTKVTAGKYAGGFSGITRDATIKALLTDLGIDLVLDPSSEIIDCKVNYETKEVNLEVYSASDYAGGFTGVTANSSITSSSVEGLKSVIAEKNYAGGFTGRATVGYAAVLGKTDEADTGLLEKIGGLLSGITAGELDPDLVNLAGIQPSKLDGCKVSGTDFTVEAKEDYAGGFFAEADGVIMDGTTKSEITGIKSVTAKNYAGGVSGKAAAANAAGVLNNTLGIGTMLAFSAKNIELNGGTNGLTVKATEDYAGGAFGQAIGGAVDKVILKDVTKVEANNYAGGFAGDAGTGSLVEGGGLNLLGLIKIDNLLSLAKGVVLNISNSSVTGTVTGTGTEENKIGLSVSSTGSNSDGAAEDFVAGGFIGESKSVVAEKCTVNNLKSVTANGTDGYAGGFTGTSASGGLADIAEDENGLEGIVSINDLLSVADYLIPEYNNCHVSYIPNTKVEDDKAQELPQVKAAVAGGFVGEMTGGKVNVTKVEDGKDTALTVDDPTAVKDIENVEGTYFAGGFAGLATSGGLAESGGLSLLGGKVQLTGFDKLLSVLEVYVPVINNAGVSAGNNGLVVSASDKMAVESKEDTEADGSKEESNEDLISSNSGAAGGYVGYGCGVQIADSDVNGLRATEIEPLKSSDSEDGSTYFSQKYAVTAPRYAGGYAGKLDIGNAASVGSGLKLGFGDYQLSFGDITDVLSIVASEVDRSDVAGKTGGFSVLANEVKEGVYTGHAGGYVGMMSGAQITSSNVDQFNYIIGGESAGGYAGTLEPGNVASVLGDASVLGKLINVQNLLSVLQTFVPKITTSTTAAVPCGGVVRAENGSAGGYAGHSLGGQIKGSADQKSAILRIRSVYGQNYAGGFTGFAEAANTADTGNLKILGGIIKLENPLSAMQAVYAVEENTAVYGPLHNMDVDMWNGWVENIGSKGPYGSEFAGKTFEGENAQEELNEFLAGYTYGYEVISPGSNEQEDIRENGYAGGYVGKMTGAHITNGQAYDLMDVTAWNSAGGFVGVMTPGSLADLGKIEAAGINVTNGLDVLKTFVSVIKQSGVTGYRSGASVEATGYKEKEKAGYAGGFVGNMIGGEIWGETSSCTVTNVNTVAAKNAVGGFAGQILPGSAASVDTSSSNALLDGLLNNIIDTNGDLASVLNTTLSTVGNVKIATTNGKGIVVQGAYSVDSKTDYAKSAGGFAGTISGAIIGAKDKPDENSDAAASGSETESSKNISLRNLQAVNGGEYAGGFAGKADTSAIAEVSGAGDTSVLDSLLNIGGLDVLDILRPYIFSAEVCGTEDYGFEVKANTAEKLTDINQEAGLYSGSAGGFIGGLLSGTVENSDVDQLRSVEGVNYSGGFVGHTGKSGLVDVDGIEALENILAVGAGVADVIGSDVNSCSVDGIADGFTVKSSGGESQIVGGFVGYADLGRMKSNTVNNLKQVSSKEIAGGFVGKTSYEYLVNLTGGGVTVDILSKLLDALLEELLHVDNLENGKVIKIDLGIIKVNALWNGKLLSVNLLGIPITASLVEGRTQLNVTIGDSEITLGIDPDDPTIDKDDLENELQVNLIKANRTRIVDSTVTGIDIGYDVFGGGASNDQDGSGDLGYAGGFAGFNNEGLLENNQMIKADTIRGTSEKVGEFDGGVSLESVWTDLDDIEKGNTYQVYRLWDDDQLKLLCNKGGDVLGTAQDNKKTAIGDTEYYLYSVNHMTAEYLMNHDDWKDAYQTPSKGSAAQFPVKVYVSGAQADLMLGTPTEENISDPDKIGETAQDPCAEKATLTIQKLWIDNNNRLGKRPKGVTVQIMRDGKLIGDKITMASKPTDADKNSWTSSVTVPIGELNADKTGYNKVYKYDVNETPVPGYTTIYNWSEDGYTLYIFNYLTSELVQGDSVVIDYGLPVQIDVLANDRVTENDAMGTLEGVAARTEDTQPGTTVSTISSAMKTEAEGSHGTAALKEVSSNTDGDTSAGSSENAQKIIEYTPGTMQMDSIDKFTYAVKLNDKVVKNGKNYVYGSLDVIPATEIYYEDNFNEDVTIKYEDQTGVNKAEDGVITTNAWTTVGTSTADVQDTDRPGINTDKIIEDVYGNDSHYADDKTYSGGSSHVIRVDKTTSSGLNGPKATFTFKGTGFDFISKTAGDTGAIRVFVYKGDTPDKNNRLEISTVQTYYGYKYSDEGEWELVDEEHLDDSALYQIPVIKYEAPEYGTYTVEIRPFYSATYDERSKGYYDLYVDGLRIYNPAGTSAEDNLNYSEIQDIYEQDGEVNPQFMELRDLLLNASGVMDTDKNGQGDEEKTGSDSLKNGIVYIDGKAGDVSLSEYKAYGPDNEVYLESNQAVAFYLVADEVPDSIELAAKLAKGKSAELSFACAVENEGTSPLTWDAYKTKTVTIASAYDMHYSISNQCWWEQTEDEKFKTKYPIIVYRDDAANDSNIISLTNLNWTGAAENSDGTDSPIEITAYADANAARAAYSLMAVQAEQEERTVTVLYQDQDGNQLADPAVQMVADGAAYDMTELVNHQIDGYIQKEILGDPVQGTADADKVITVVYEKEAPKLYTVTVSYVDREGNVLSEAYVQENAAEGTSYDLTEQTGKEIKGYEIAEITGDAVKGTVSGDVNVTVVYEKEPSVIDTIVDAVVDGINKVVDGINKVVDWVSDVVSSIFPWW